MTKRSPSREHTSSCDPKSTDRSKSSQETFEASKEKNDERTGTDNMIHELRSHQGNNEVHTSYGIPNSPKLISNNHNTSHKKSITSSFLRSSKPIPFSGSPSSLRSGSHTSQTPSQTQSRLSKNFTRQSVDMTKSHDVRAMKRRGWSHQFKTKNMEQTAGSMAHSGPILRSERRSRSPAIVYSRSNGLVKLLTVEESLECSLEELCFGCVKSITVARAVIADNGQVIDEEETLSIEVKPEWTKGTRISFEGTKNEEKGTHSCDVIFVITEKKHDLYRREGNDLELVARIPLVQALTGCTLSVPLLGGDTMKLTIDEIIEPGYEKIIEGQGMPKSKEKGHRGNLKITFLVDFPKELTEDQKRDIATILQDSC